MRDYMISPFVFCEPNSLVSVSKMEYGNQSVLIMGRSRGESSSSIDCRDKAISIAKRCFGDCAHTGYGFELAVDKFVREWKDYVKKSYQLIPRDLLHGLYDNVRREVEPDSFLVVRTLDKRILVLEYGKAYTRMIFRAGGAEPIVRKTNYSFSDKGGNVFRVIDIPLERADELPIVFAFSERPYDKAFEDEYIRYVKSLVKYGVGMDNINAFNRDVGQYVASYCDRVRLDFDRNERTYGFWFGAILLYGVQGNAGASGYTANGQHARPFQAASASNQQKYNPAAAPRGSHRKSLKEKQTRLLSEICSLQEKRKAASKDLAQVTNQIEYIEKQHEKQLASYSKKKELYDRFEVYQDDSVTGGAV